MFRVCYKYLCLEEAEDLIIIRTRWDIGGEKGLWIWKEHPMIDMKDEIRELKIIVDKLVEKYLEDKRNQNK